MSDSFTDAYRPDWRPKGFGWWDDANQKEFIRRKLESKSAEEIDDLNFWHKAFIYNLIDQKKMFEMHRKITGIETDLSEQKLL